MSPEKRSFVSIEVAERRIVPLFESYFRKKLKGTPQTETIDLAGGEICRGPIIKEYPDLGTFVLSETKNGKVVVETFLRAGMTYILNDQVKTLPPDIFSTIHIGHDLTSGPLKIANTKVRREVTFHLVQNPLTP